MKAIFLCFFFLCVASQYWKNKRHTSVVPPFEAHFSMNLQVFPEYPVAAPLETEFSALVELQAKTKQGPTEFAVLLDRSGSMWSERMMLAKLAIEDLITHMADKDLVHLIAYDETAEVIFTDGTTKNAAKMLAKLDQIESRGISDLAQGLDLSLDVLLAEDVEDEPTPPPPADPTPPFVLDPATAALAAAGLKVGIPSGIGATVPHPVSARVERTKLIVLITDGKPNGGETSPHMLVEGVQALPGMNVTLVVIGVGADQDVQFLDALAQSAFGKYLPLEHGTQIEHFLSFGLRGFDEVMARNASVVITPKEGLKVTQIRGPFNPEGTSIVVPFFRYGSRASFLIFLEFDFDLDPTDVFTPSPKPQPGEKYKVKKQESIVTCKLEFDAVKQITPEQLKVVSFVKVESGVWLNVSDDEDNLAKARENKHPRIRLRHAVDWVSMLQDELNAARAAEDMELVFQLEQSFVANFYEHFPPRTVPEEVEAIPAPDTTEAAPAAACEGGSAGSATEECTAVLPE